MSEYKRTIVEKKADQVIPVGYLNNLLANNPGRWGFAVVVDSKIQMDYIDTAPTVKELEQFLDQFKEYEIFMSFSNYPADSDAANGQPFVIIRKGDDIKMVGFMEGHFPKYESDDPKGYSPALFAVQKNLIPKLNKIFLANEADMPSFEGEVFDDPMFTEDVTNIFGDHGSILLLSQTGNHNKWKMDLNHREGEFEWGWVSDAHGFGTEPEKEAEPEPVKTEAKVIKFSKAAPKATGAPPGNAQPVTAKPEPESIQTVPPSPDSSEFEYVEVPSKVISNRGKKKEWIRKMLGTQHLPADWEVAKAIRVPKSRIKAINSNLKSTTAAAPNADKEPLKLTKDVAPKHVHTDTKAEEVMGGRVVEKVPIILAEHKKKITEDFRKREGVVKAIDGHLQEIKDPQKLKDIESRFPTFWDALGLPQSDTDGWPHAVLVSLAEEYPTAAAILIANYRSLAREALELAIDTKENLREEEIRAEIKAEEKSPPSTPATQKMITSSGKKITFKK